MSAQPHPPETHSAGLWLGGGRTTPADFAALQEHAGHAPRGQMLSPSQAAAGGFSSAPRAVRAILVSYGKAYLWATYEVLTDLVWQHRRTNQPGELELAPRQLVAKLREQLGYSRATAYRHLAFLEAMGLQVRHAPEGRARYGPGARLCLRVVHYLVTKLERQERANAGVPKRGRATGRARAMPPPAHGPPPGGQAVVNPT